MSLGFQIQVSDQFVNLSLLLFSVGSFEVSIHVEMFSHSQLREENIVLRTNPHILSHLVHFSKNVHVKGFCAP